MAYAFSLCWADSRLCGNLWPFPYKEPLSRDGDFHYKDTTVVHGRETVLSL